MHHITPLWAPVLLAIGTTVTSLPTADVTVCSPSDVTVVLRGYNPSLYRGTPYVKGYENIKDCIRHLTFDPSTHTYSLQFSMDFSDVTFGADQYSVYRPTTSVCARVYKEDSFQKGSFESTVVLPKSSSIEMFGDLTVHVFCTWDNLAKPGYNGSADVRELTQLPDNPDVTIRLMTSSGVETSAVSLGERVTLGLVTSQVWDVAGFWSIQAVSKTHHKKQLIDKGCLVTSSDLQPINVSLTTPLNSPPSVTFTSFRFYNQPLLQLDVTLRLCVSAHAQHCDMALTCNQKNKTPKPAQLGSRPHTKAARQPLEYVEVTQSISLLVSDRDVTRQECTTIPASAPLSSAVLVLTSKDITTVTVIVFFILTALVVSAGSILTYRVVLYRRYHSASVDLWRVALRRPSTPPSLATTPSDSPCRGEGAWIRNRLITPPPNISNSLRFSNQISPLGSHATSTIDGKHYSTKWDN